MENFESQQYRDELAKEIKEAPKDSRAGILENAKQTTEYWQTRGEKISERQNEEEIDGGLGVFIKKKTLYHGSGTSGIESFNEAKEATVGSGTYFTSEARNAIGYAHRRTRGVENASPVIYESTVENMKLLDLRKDTNVKTVLNGFRKLLLEKLKQPDLSWHHQESLRRPIEVIDSGVVHSGNLRDVTYTTGQMFSEYCKSLGYEGLVTFEGGEGDEVGHHDTYLIFDPKKVTISQEHPVL